VRSSGSCCAEHARPPRHRSEETSKRIADALIGHGTARWRDQYAGRGLPSRVLRASPRTSRSEALPISATIRNVGSPVGSRRNRRCAGLRSRRSAAPLTQYDYKKMLRPNFGSLEHQPSRGEREIACAPRRNRCRASRKIRAAYRPQPIAARHDGVAKHGDDDEPGATVRAVNVG